MRVEGKRRNSKPVAFSSNHHPGAGYTTAPAYKCLQLSTVGRKVQTLSTRRWDGRCEDTWRI